MYRARTLLIPADLLRSSPWWRAINSALAAVGMRIVLARPGRRPVRAGGRAGDALRQLPRVAVLEPTAEPGKPALPVMVDAWTALQALPRGRRGRRAGEPARAAEPEPSP